MLVEAFNIMGGLQTRTLTSLSEFIEVLSLTL